LIIIFNSCLFLFESALNQTFFSSRLFSKYTLASSINFSLVFHSILLIKILTSSLSSQKILLRTSIYHFGDVKNLHALFEGISLNICETIDAHLYIFQLIVIFNLLLLSSEFALNQAFFSSILFSRYTLVSSKNSSLFKFSLIFHPIFFIKVLTSLLSSQNMILRTSIYHFGDLK
jgi:hypothetical protein